MQECGNKKNRPQGAVEKGLHKFCQRIRCGKGHRTVWGFKLARPAELITVLDVAQAIDGEKNMFECREVRQRLALFDDAPPAWACDGPCGVRSVMDSAQKRMEEELSRHTILDLARKMFRKAPDTFQIEVQEWIADRRSTS